MRVKVIIIIMVMIMHLPVINGVKMTQGSGLTNMEFEDIQIDANLLLNIDDTGIDGEERVLMARVITQQGVNLKNNYYFGITICQNELDYVKLNNVTFEPKLVQLGWCLETNGYGFEVGKNLNKNQINVWYEIRIPKQQQNITIYYGQNSGIKIGIAYTLLNNDGHQENCVRDSNNYLYCFERNTAAYPMIMNSTDDGITWDILNYTSGLRLYSGEVVILSNDDIYWIAGDGNDVNWVRRLSGVWQSAATMPGFNAGGGNNRLGGNVQAVVDSNDVIHIMVQTGSYWNGTSGRYLDIYSNYTVEQGWYGDGSVVDSTNLVYNGTMILGDPANCSYRASNDLDVYEDDVYFFYIGTDIHLWVASNVDDWTSRNMICDSGNCRNPMSARIDYNTGNIYVLGSTASSALTIYNTTISNWNMSGDTQIIDSVAYSGSHSNVDVSAEENIYIVNEERFHLTNHHLYEANSTDYALTWDYNNSHIKLPETGVSAETSMYVIRGTTYPTFNRLTNKAEGIYFNDSDDGIYYYGWEIPYNPVTDTCTFPNDYSLNHTINMGDACEVIETSYCDNLFFYGIGNFTVNSTLNVSSIINLTETIYVKQYGIINILGG